MQKQMTAFSDRQFRWVTYIVVAIAGVILLVNLVLLGGNTFVFSFNSAINAPMAIVITIAAMTAWHKVGTEKNRRLLWAGILIGWALWALAEVIYSLYSILGQEAPYPSVADIFWMVGYIPMGLGLYLRSRTMPVKPTRAQTWTIIAFSTATILLAGIFVFWPTFQSFDPSTPLENLINIAYPVEDCLLLIVVWRLFFTYEKGEHGFGWRLLAIGFILLTIGDLIYLYANSTDPILYYPDLKANLISRFGADVPYSFSYLCWMLGIFALRIPPKKEEQQPVSPILLKTPQKYCHLLVFTKQDNTVIDVSPNYSLLFTAPQIKGKNLADILNISREAGRSLNEKLKTEKKVTDLPVQLPQSLIGPVEAQCCGIAVYDPQGGYAGANLLFSIPVQDDSFNAPLNAEKRLMARRLLDITGSCYKEELAQFLQAYFRPFFQGLYQVAQAEGGSQMSTAFLYELTKTANLHSWNIRFNSNTVLDTTDCSWDVLRKALPALLETAKQFVSKITDEGTVEMEIKSTRSRFDETVEKEIAAYINP